MEFSLQAAQSPGRLKPELRTTCLEFRFGVQPSGWTESEQAKAWTPNLSALKQLQPDATGVLQFGTPKYTMAGNSQFLVNGNTTKMMITMIPSKQTSFRKVTGLTDPW